VENEAREVNTGSEKDLKCVSGESWKLNKDSEAYMRNNNILILMREKYAS
jgi:hypothetical protein